jgi:hypothetical protein
MKLKHTIDVYDCCGDNDGFGKEMEDSIEKTPTNLKANLGARLPNARKNLERTNDALKFQLKMLEFMTS